MKIHPEATGAYLNEAFTRHIKADDISVILELGSRNGMDALALADYYNADVFAFECRPDAVEECAFNTQDDARVCIIDKAVWDDDCDITFHPVVNGNDGASSCFLANPEYPYEQYDQTSITVKAIRLDYWLSDCRIKPDMVCMDLQGAERAALIGMGNHLRSVKCVITEVQEKPLYKDTPLLDDIKSILGGYGLYLEEYVPVNEWFGDALFVRQQYTEEELIRSIWEHRDDPDGDECEKCSGEVIDPVGRSFDEVEGSPKNDVTLSRRQAEDLLEILAEFRSQHLREAAWDYPQFDFQRRMLVNLGEIEAQVYQSMQGLSE